MKRSLATALLLCALVPTAAAAAADVPAGKPLYQDGPGGRLLMDGEWLFRPDPQDQGLAQGFATQADTAGWAKTTVPNAWNAGDNSPESQRGTVGWYRKDFTAPKGGGDFKVRFESVNYRATVYLNGKQVGAHEGASIPFEVPAAKLSSAGVNRLVLRVDNRRTDTDIPPIKDSDVTGLPGGGWWNYGGLLREVYLRRFKGVDVSNVAALPTVKGHTAEVTVRATLDNPAGGSRRVTVAASIGGSRVDFGSVAVPGGGTRTVTKKATVRGARLWSPDRPRLYPVKVTARAGGKDLSTYSSHIGLRTITVDPAGRVRINGKRYDMRGASVHEDDPKLGAALTPEKRAGQIRLLKQLGANMTRAHYPLHPDFLEQCDRAGILVWEQIPFYRYPESTIALGSVQKQGLQYLQDTLARDSNHASVLAWSVANELPRDPGPGQTKYAKAAIRRIHATDPTRLAAIDIAGYPSVRLVSLYREFDAIGTNSYFGWYPGPSGSVLNRAVLGPYLDQLHSYYPTKALFVTEFGAEANRDGAVDDKGSFAFQSDFMKYHLQTYDSKPYLNGAVAWLLQDFKVRPDWDGYNSAPSPPYNKKGLVDEAGNAKPAFAETAASFKAKTR